MSARTILSITWLWIASLLIATVGVSGQQIYCYCAGKTTFSLFATADACAEKQLQGLPPCCARFPAMPMGACCEKKAEKSVPKGCTKKTTKVFSLKTEFTFQEKSAEKSPLHPIGLPIVLAPISVSYNQLHHFKIGFKPFAQPPPPLSGRMISVRHGVFLC